MARFTEAQYRAYLAKQHQFTEQREHISEHSVAERDIHAQIEDECRRRGWYFVHARVDKPTTIGIGTPDFIIAREDGKTLWIEVKTSTGKMTPEQAATAAWLKKLGHKWAIVRSFDEFIAMTDGEKNC